MRSIWAAILGLGVLPVAAWGQPGVAVTWGGMGSNPFPNVLFRDIAGADSSNIAGIRDDGTILQWGDFWGGTSAMVPSGRFTQIDGGIFSFAAIREDGTLAAWGVPFLGNLNVPTGTFKAVSIGKHANIAIRTDGSLAVWGAGLTPAPPGNDFVAVTTGEQAALALRSDGSVVGLGTGGFGELNVPPGPYKGIALTKGYAAGILQDGTLRFWGTFAPAAGSMPGTFTQIDIGFAGGSPVGLRTDGTLAMLQAPPGFIPSGTYGVVAAGESSWMAIVPAPQSGWIVVGVLGAWRRRRGA